MKRHCNIALASTTLLLAAAVLSPGTAVAQEVVVIGTWAYEDASLREKVVISKSGTEYFALVESGQGGRKFPLAGRMDGGVKRFLRKGSKEYYQIETTGDLGLYDGRGMIRSLKRTDKPRDYCYKAGWEFGRVAKTIALAGKDIKKTIRVRIPEECEGLPETRKGISDGAAVVQP